ncbi:zinc finger CCCH domain-containing protein 31 [Cucurbita maxima]|uniref:Zinc finger CCCH domain-containing protein 31 n=1 Tax=Cucurbita maxima TaxID=3661 RepID=A0A6J1HVM0_CUCMA|nr:zinc finger CCCH domain-containing protein 31 [Cucurbita maxima]
MDMRKRGRPEAAFNSNGSFKKHKQELESLSTVGGKSKPCTKFFSTAGCPFGESCHFLHYVPGGYNAVAQMMNLAPVGSQPSRNMAAPPVSNGGSSAPSQIKTRMCNKFNSAEGCKFGDKCNFAHGEWELGRPTPPSHDNPRGMGGGHMVGRMGGRMDLPPPGPAASFGASATAKISIDASLAGAIIGKGGINSKQICRQTGAKLSIRDNESDPNLRNIELEGTFEQINEASAMVRELIITVSMSGPGKAHGAMGGGGPAPSGSNYKTKLCDNFAKGSCTFGERCHFAHGAAELRKSGV